MCVYIYIYIYIYIYMCIYDLLNMKFFWGKLTSRLVVCIFCASSQYLNAGSNNHSV